MDLGAFYAGLLAARCRSRGRRGPVGYLFREDGRWVSDLDESPLGREIGRYLGRVVTADLPRWTAAVTDRAGELAHLREVVAESPSSMPVP